MAEQKITYPLKRTDDPWQSHEANEIKIVVNHHADTIDNINARLAAGDPTPVVAQSLTTATIQPNRLNRWGTVNSLAITLQPSGVSGVSDEFMLEFTVGSSQFTLTFGSSTIRWAQEPDWQEGYTYQVSIENDLAIYAEWEAAQS